MKSIEELEADCEIAAQMVKATETALRQAQEDHAKAKAQSRIADANRRDYWTKKRSGRREAVS